METERQSILPTHLPRFIYKCLDGDGNMFCVRPTVFTAESLEHRTTYKFLTSRIFSKSLLISGQNDEFVQGVPLATEPGISLIILPLMRILQRNLKRTYLIV